MSSCPLAEWLTNRPLTNRTRGAIPIWERKPFTLGGRVRRNKPRPSQGIIKQRARALGH